MPEHTQSYESWGIVEVMGHKKYSGFVGEQIIAGAALVRVDVPETVGCAGNVTKAYTKLFGVGSIYCITPCTEEIARKAAEVLNRYENPIPVAIPAERQIPATVGGGDVEDAQLALDDDDHGNDWEDDDDD